ncbi:MAG: hypothetical protein AB7I18_15130 [Candidatus Berkiella sp.]
MKELNSREVAEVNAGSILGVLGYGTIGFWVGAIAGLPAGIVMAIPGAIVGMTIGAYLGTDGTPPQVIIIQDAAKKAG